MSNNSFHLPKWEELPDFPIYIDQVIYYVEQHIGVLYYNDEKFITNSMINNYVKNGIVEAPVKKKYEREQVAYIIIICLLKKAYTLDEISQLFDVQMKSFTTERAYNYFCKEFETCLSSIIYKNEIEHIPSNSDKTDIVYLLHNTVLALTHKIYVQYLLNYKKNQE